MGVLSLWSVFIPFIARVPELRQQLLRLKQLRPNLVAIDEMRAILFLGDLNRVLLKTICLSVLRCPQSLLCYVRPRKL